MQPLNLSRELLFLDENGAELTVLSEGCYAVVVELFFLGFKPCEEVCDECWVCCLVNLVCVHFI